MKNKIAYFFLTIGVIDTLDLLFFKVRNLPVGNILFPYIVFIILRFIPWNKILNNLFNIDSTENNILFQKGNKHESD
ncbi:hypothetical protein P7G58_06450 [Globicatella sulfidifaciens]|uniref:hypothetical protein n=1 Tax=Globicatella sulfidifaciens TaxID=136093 RepID=UPI00288DE5AB|nr:hypothetical protein [Globicatella sulfidifaciens]MDT2768497.1 hypothetical protein [Globicatella sulfidifaciens]